MEAVKLNGVVYKYKVREAAELCGKDPSHIRRVCIDRKIGKMFAGQLRLLSEADITKLEKHFEENGRKSKNSG